MCLFDCVWNRQSIIVYDNNRHFITILSPCSIPASHWGQVVSPSELQTKSRMAILLFCVNLYNTAVCGRQTQWCDYSSVGLIFPRPVGIVTITGVNSRKHWERHWGLIISVTYSLLFLGTWNRKEVICNQPISLQIFHVPPPDSPEEVGSEVQW